MLCMGAARGSALRPLVPSRPLRRRRPLAARAASRHDAHHVEQEAKRALAVAAASLVLHLGVGTAAAAAAADTGVWQQSEE